MSSGAAALLLGAAGCGAAATTPAATAPLTTSARATTPAAAGSVPAATPAATAATSTPTAGVASAACRHDAHAELEQIAQRIYAQGSAGRNSAAAVRRIGDSRALATAVAASDRAAVRTTLRPLIKNQITRIEIRDAAGRRLAGYGTAQAYAPVRGSIVDGGRIVGSYVLSVSNRSAFISLVRGLTGISASFHPGAAAATSGPAQQHVFAATDFPRGAATIALRLPPVAADLCGPTAADTRLLTIGWVGQRLVADEEHGPAALRTIDHAQRNRAFRAAIKAHDGSALWNAIVHFFRDSRYHVVRVRAWDGPKLIGDVGGPYVLDPAEGVIHDHGKVIGRFLLAIQDDTGYIKLMHRFTGADVVLHTTTRTVPGSNLTPGPAYAPGLTHVRYRGERYRAVGFQARAFPSDPLEVSLLSPANAVPTRSAPAANHARRMLGR